jgi:Type 9 secretion system plug protein 1st domain
MPNKMLLLSLILGFFFYSSEAQIIEKIEPYHIRTIQFRGGTQQSRLPIIRLGEPLLLSFDDINGDEADYYYRITHYDFDWTPSDLSKGEYLDGFDDIRIVNYENSLNSLQIYSHYTLRIPNEDTRGVLKSGNYLMSIYNYDGDLVFTRKFMVMLNEVKVAVNIKRSRTLKYINAKQSVQFIIDSPGLLLIDPNESVKTLVLQNSNLNSAITDLKPQYTIGSQLIYRYDLESSFWGGNEFLNFDSSELLGANISIRRVELTDIYEHFLYTRSSRANAVYTYYPDINGDFVVRSARYKNNSIQAEYVRIHFNFQYFEDIEDKEIHIYGNFNNWSIDESTYLSYNEISDSYQTTRLFKQGFYNYRFVLVDRDGSIDEGTIGGNYWETENDYTVLVYYRGPGERFDRIIGYGKSNSRIITNN